MTIRPDDLGGNEPYPFDPAEPQYETSEPPDRSQAENQQTVEAMTCPHCSAPWMKGTGLFLCGEGISGHVAGGCRVYYTGRYISDLAAQASRTREWKQLAEDMGEMLRSHRCKRESGYRLPVKVIGASIFQNGDPEPLPVDACPTCALLARLHDLPAEQDGT